MIMAVHLWLTAFVSIQRSLNSAMIVAEFASFNCHLLDCADVKERGLGSPKVNELSDTRHGRGGKKDSGSRR